jgi:hypothetical protein
MGSCVISLRPLRPRSFRGRLQFRPPPGRRNGCGHAELRRSACFPADAGPGLGSYRATSKKLDGVVAVYADLHLVEVVLALA